MSKHDPRDQGASANDATASPIDSQRRRLLQATVAAGGMHALGAFASENVDGVLGGDTLFTNGFETAPPPTGGSSWPSPPAWASCATG